MSRENVNGEMVAKSEAGLRKECLSPMEVLAQSIANIAPSATPAFTIPLVFAMTGNGTWLAYVFATLVVLLVGHHVNQFAKRSSTPGALYTYVGEGMGGRAGFLSGWVLVLAYILTGSATLAGFSKYINVLGSYIGIQIPVPFIMLAGIISIWFVVSRDVKISAKLMLTLEAVSLTFIFILGAIVLFKHGFHVDMAQVRLHGVTFDSVRLGLVLAFFSFVGFESATALGDEAKNPLKNIPKAVITSGLFVGFVFIVFSYIEVVGYIGSTESLADSGSPLSYLASSNGVGFMGLVISIGATVSFWSCVVACLTASARIIMSMAQDKILHTSLAETHKTFSTPHIAVRYISVIAFIVPAVMSVFGIDEMSIFSYTGTIATLGFLFSYVMIVVAVPFYLTKRNELKIGNIILSLVTFVLLLIPIVGSVYPLPAFPFNLFPFIFLAWLVIGIIWYEVKNISGQSVSENA